MASFKQHADGSLSVFSDVEQKSLFRIGGPANPAPGGSDQNYRARYAVKIPLNTSGQGSAAAASWQNNSGDDLIATGCFLNITTNQTATLALSAGINSIATTLDTNLIDSITLTAVAAGVFDNITDKGTNGKSRQQLPNGSFVNVSTNALGSIGSLRGSLYLEVIKV